MTNDICVDLCEKYLLLFKVGIMKRYAKLIGLLETMISAEIQENV